MDGCCGAASGEREGDRERAEAPSGAPLRVSIEYLGRLAIAAVHKQGGGARGGGTRGGGAGGGGALEAESRSRRRRHARGGMRKAAVLEAAALEVAALEAVVP